MSGSRSKGSRGLFRAVLLAVPVLLCGRPVVAARYVQTNLVSNIPGLAANPDANLLNPWGITSSATGPFWVADNHQGVATLYNGSGTPQALVVTIPPPAGSPAGTRSTPTGIVFNTTNSFDLSPGMKALFLFATEDGTISGWNGGTNAVLKVDNSPFGAIYKGLALGTNAGSDFLFATNFHAGTVDVFDTNFAPVAVAFTDPTIPAGFAPFGIQNIGGTLYVTYALQDATGQDDMPGLGNGFVDAFDTAGNFLRRVASQGSLNSPWGLALSPASFGMTALLVGNFGDGVINAFDLATGIPIGPLRDPFGNPIVINGLWGLRFGNGGNGGQMDILYFTAGINGEADGLLGALQLLPPTPIGAPALGNSSGLPLLVLLLFLVGASILWIRSRA